MKNRPAVLLIVLSASLAFGDLGRLPQMLRLKGRFSDSDQAPLTDNLPVRFSIWDTEDGYGRMIWEDVQSVSIQNNLFQVVLGRAKPLPPSVFSGKDCWVELQVGNDPPLRPRHKIPSQYIQAQVAAAAAPQAPIPAPVAPAVLPPAVVAPAAPPVAPAAAPGVTDQEQRDLELQIEKYKETEREAAPPPVSAPVKQAKRKHIVKPIVSSGELGPIYEVQNGDTLKSIAQKLYGKAELWYDLYYLNRDRLGPMGHLFPGQILVLPVKAAGEGSQ